MAKLGGIDFEDCIFDALHDDKFVVFAGAGVSMGAPSSLPSFEKLANGIAQGTGQVASVPLDRFLGQLHHSKVEVHERAAKLLSPADSEPNALHHDLLKLFHSCARVRLVTTNFDHHFESAARTSFGNLPDVYRAPALPLGRDFHGIVHVHGSVARPSDMVLTDADFGRAYLTEGWARRFLVEVFRSYTVLFVGYSHADVVMNYLARALPANSGAGRRFALTEEDGNWVLLGIKPIRFNKSAATDAYKDLYDGVQRLAHRVTRGVLDWQARLAQIGGGAPPADEEAIGEVEHALHEVQTTRFLTDVARHTEWPKWLSARKHLDALFGDAADLSDRDKVLASWLAQHFAIEHPDAMFDLLAAHGMRLNPVFWWCIGREIGVTKEKTLGDSALKRWVTILLASAPDQADYHVLMWLAERCNRQGAVHLTLRLFFRMSEQRLNIKPGFVWKDQEDVAHGGGLDVHCPLRADHWSLNEVWTKHVKPHVGLNVQFLLSGIAHRFEQIHQDLMAWDKGSRDWDPISYGRSAIEPHEQDRHREAIDVLIDAARDTLEWLAANSTTLLDAWIDRLIGSDVPILRRMAIYAVTVHPTKSADDRLYWLMNCVGVHGVAEHHEIYRLLALCYPPASTSAQQMLVGAVCAYKLQASDGPSAEEQTARAHFDALSWLLRAKPDCPLVEAALLPIKAAYPEWQYSDHPDFTHWFSEAEWIGHQSPWSAGQLLAKEPREQLDDLLAFKGNRFRGPDRTGLLAAIKEACKQQAHWAFAFAEVLAERSLWSSDLWSSVIRGWQEADLTVDDWGAVLTTAAKRELHVPHSYDLANLLYAIVRDGGKPAALGLLEQANVVAFPLWQTTVSDEGNDNIDDWLSHAINHPAGVIVEFWIDGLSLLMRGKLGPERTLPENYRQWFTLVVQDSTSKGGLGRSVLASQTAFLFGLDQTWTQQYIVPLFSDTDRKKFAQAWDGFLVWGRLYPALADAIMPAFISAVARLDGDLPDRRQRFVEFYTALAVFHVADPTQQLLPTLFRHGTTEDRITFASHLGYFLRQMQQETKQGLWDRWLLRYWQERQQGVPALLHEAEITKMLDWLPHFGDLFPMAVSLMVRSLPIRIEHSHMLYELRESDLVTRYPAETAELLIYICNCVIPYQVADVATVAGRLPAVAPHLKRRLDEGLLRIGAK